MPAPSKVGLLFIDGVGVGARDASFNPLTESPLLLSQFSDGSGTRLPDGGERHDVDTTFGVSGRPQSASNQTALYTGLPAPQLIGSHVLGYPTRPLAALLAESSIVRTLQSRGRATTFANGYPIGYLDALGLERNPGSLGAFALDAKLKRRLKPSASTLAFAAGKVPFRTLDDVMNAQALTHDIDGTRAGRRRFEVPRRTVTEAAEIFWNVSRDFTLFEHMLADEAGHAQDRTLATEVLETFDQFARAVIRLRPADAQVLICSDHGNVEDLSSRNHTRNPVAVLSFGPAQLEQPATLADIGQQIVRWLS